MKYTLTIRSTLIVSYLLVACFSMWQVGLAAAFSWSPDGNPMQWIFNLSEGLCYLLVVSAILLLWKSRWASLLGFLSSAGLILWWTDMPFYLFNSLLEYGIIDLTHIFYLICLLAYVYCLFMSLFLSIRSFFYKINLPSASGSEIRYISLLVTCLLSAGFIGWLATDKLEHAAMHDLPLPGKWWYITVSFICFYLMVMIGFLIPRGKRIWPIVGFACMLILLPQWIDVIKLMFRINDGINWKTALYFLGCVPLFYLYGLGMMLFSCFRPFKLKEQ